IFFFQAEDGIRDLIVTGVQTCALPIYPSSVPPPRCDNRHGRGQRHISLDRAGCPAVAGGYAGARRDAVFLSSAATLRLEARRVRSEERRVGKSVDLSTSRIYHRETYCT